MKLADSSVWLHHLEASPLSEAARQHLATPNLLVPTVVLYEVYRVLARERPGLAAQTVAFMQQHEVVPLSSTLALEAAQLGREHSLAMADAIIYATTRHHDAELVTSDQHFAGLPGVTMLSEQQPGAKPTKQGKEKRP